MAISPIPPNSSVSAPAQVKTTDTEAMSARTTDQQPAQKATADTVANSKQAVQMASQLYSPQEEAKETPIQKAVEAAQGRK